MTEAPKPRLGLVGLGIMGLPIARRLRDRGYALTVWNLEPERFDGLQGTGAVWADGPAALWAESDIALLCVLGEDAVSSVCFGAGGFASGAPGARLLIDLSTTSPEATRSFAARLGTETGAAWVDAPMSGGPDAAAAGTLTLMAGAAPETWVEAEPVLAALARNVTRVGDLGQGQTTKLINQAIVGCSYVLMAEILAFARATGVDPALLPGCLAGGLADSAALQRILPLMAAEDFDPPRSYARQVDKDLRAVRQRIATAKLDLPLIAQAIGIYQAFVAAGNDMADGIAISRHYAC
jgi:3-hydroxyisobutyrate dehydrogenase